MLRTIFTDVSFIKPEDSLNPLFMAILYSGKVWKFVTRPLPKMHIRERGREGADEIQKFSLLCPARIIFNI